MKTRKIIFATMLVLLAIGQSVMAQTYQSTGNGNWTSLSTWEELVDESWVAATSFPGQTSSIAVVTIGASHQVYINPGANITIQDINVEASGKLTLHPGGKINIADKMEMAGSTVAAIVVNSEQPDGTIDELNCDEATLYGTLTEGEAADGVSVEVPYTGGDGGNHFGQTVVSTSVAGLTAVLESGTFFSGDASLTYTITGTPSAAGDAIFALEIGGISCALTAAIASAGPVPCPGYETITDVDGNVYNTVLIGGQCWMAENLRVTQYNNGNAIPTDLSNADWGSTTVGAYAVYPHSEITGLTSDEEVLEAYGALYNWHAVADTKGLCPTGWSVPSDDDWKELEVYLGMSQAEADKTSWRGTNEGRKLKSERTAVGNPPVGISTNDHPRWDYNADNFGLDQFGFSALPGGYRHADGVYNFIGNNGTWWSSNEGSSPTWAWNREMTFFLGFVSRAEVNKENGFSVRCFRDIE